MNTIRHTIGLAIKYKQVVLTVMTVLLLFGTFAILEMPRQEFPEFPIRQGVVVGIYPGASSHQVEEQLTIDVENYLYEHEEVHHRNRNPARPRGAETTSTA